MSDDSYYDEIEDYELAAINESEIQLKNTQTKRKLNQSASKAVMKRQLEQNTNKMLKIFEVADLLNEKVLQDSKISYLSNFMKNMPAF